jgi:hypothetical protein
MLALEVVMRSTDTDATFLDTTITRFTRAEWDLLVRLPGQVVVAATADPDGTPGSMAEAIAGLDAVAAGRGSTNALVRQVVGTIYAEPDSESSVAEGGFGSAADRTSRFVEVLVACRHAAAVLAAHGSAADRLAYERWLTSIAFRVCPPADRPDGSTASGSTASGGTPCGATVSLEQRFLAALATAFRREDT